MLNSFGDLLVFLSNGDQGVAFNDQHLEGQDYALIWRDCTDVLYEHSEEESLHITFRLTETMYFKILGLSFMGYVMRL